MAGSQTLRIVLFSEDEDDPENAGIRREPTLPKHEAIAPEQPTPAREFAVFEDEPGCQTLKAEALPASETSS
jgi:type IV secretion system protein VirD4